MLESAVSSPIVDNPFVGQRIREYRRREDLSQDDFARQLGFANRQTLQTIESGARRLHVPELLRLLEVTGETIEYFTDPFLWIGDGVFSYRAQQPDDAALTRFEEEAGKLVSVWRWMRTVSATDTAVLPMFDLGSRSTFEDAHAFAEQLIRWLRLGDVPADRLATTIEQELGIPVLFIEMPMGISGATCHHDDGTVMFINRNDAPGRRNFDLAHELFHVLTWAQHQPERIDMGAGAGVQTPALSRSARRLEQLADNFAGALLMPRDALLRRWEQCRTSRDLPAELRASADHFRVSVPALLWRLVTAGCLKAEQVPDLEAMAALQASGSEYSPPLPALLSRYYFEFIGEAIAQGRVSARRVAALLGMDLLALEDAFAAHSLDIPFDL